MMVLLRLLRVLIQTFSVEVAQLTLIIFFPKLISLVLGLATEKRLLRFVNVIDMLLVLLKFLLKRLSLHLRQERV